MKHTRFEKIKFYNKIGDRLWAKGYRLDDLKEYGRSDHYKAQGNGFLGKANDLFYGAPLNERNQIQIYYTGGLK